MHLTLKAQVLLDWEASEIVTTAFNKGRTHDCKLFKHSCTYVHLDTRVLANFGYLGLERVHVYSFLPANASKHHLLNYEVRRAKCTLTSICLHIERIIGRLKVSRILAEPYRGCRKHFSLRFNLTSSVHNFALNLSSALLQWSKAPLTNHVHCCL